MALNGKPPSQLGGQTGSSCQHPRSFGSNPSTTKGNLSLYVSLMLLLHEVCKIKLRCKLNKQKWKIMTLKPKAENVTTAVAVSFLPKFLPFFLLVYPVTVKSPRLKLHQCKKCKRPTALNQTLSTTRKSNNNITQKRSVTIEHIWKERVSLTCSMSDLNRYLGCIAWYKQREEQASSQLMWSLSERQKKQQKYTIYSIVLRKIYNSISLWNEQNELGTKLLWCWGSFI